MKPHQKKSGRSRPETTTQNDDPTLPVFFYYPGESPYGLFSQWKSTRFTVSASTLTWISTAHPAQASKASSTPEAGTGTIEFNCAEQFMMYAKSLIFHDGPSGSKILLSKTHPNKRSWVGK